MSTTLTTTDLIKQLPLEKSVQEDLLQKFPSLDTDQKYEVSRILWELHDSLIEEKIDEKFYEELAAVIQGKAALSVEMYQKAQTKALIENKGETEKIVTKDELTGVRNKLQSLITQTN